MSRPAASERGARLAASPAGGARGRLGLGLGLSALARVALGIGALGIGACHFEIPGLLLPSADGGEGGDLAVIDGAVDQLLVDLAQPDLSGLCMPGGPTSACSSDSLALLTCVNGFPLPTPCDVSCSTEGTPHCTRVDPGGVAEPGDYELPGLVDLTLSGPITFNTDTGAVTAGTLDRVGGSGVISGVGFRAASQSNGVTVGVFSFRSLTFAPGSTVNVVGLSPISIVAAGNLTIGGGLDVQGSCAPGARVAGGGLGGAAKFGVGNPGGGSGAGLGGQTSAIGAGGGGGAGHGDVGGLGAVGAMAASGGSGGPLFGDLTQANPLLIGGSGGGAGGGGVATLGGAGGGGGGAIQLVSNASVLIGAGAVLQAGGCHGSAAAGGFGAGGGGGAGGMILIESRVILVSPGAILVSNGGAGGGGGNGNPGDDGQPDLNQAMGGSGGSSSGKRGSDGGDGGITGFLFGLAGVGITGAEIYGGGGGGAVGRIALKSKNGVVSLIGVDLSPKIGESTPGRAAPARLGTVGFR